MCAMTVGHSPALRRRIEHLRILRPHACPAAACDQGTPSVFPPSILRNTAWVADDVVLVLCLQEGLRRASVLDIIIVKEDPVALLPEMLERTPPEGLLKW